MDADKLVLAPDETVLLTQTPDWSKAASRFRFGAGKLFNFLIAGALTWGAFSLFNDKQVGTAVVVGVFAAFSILLLFSTTQQQEARKIVDYTLTNKRILVRALKPEARTSIAASAIRGVHVRRNGAVDDIAIRYGQGEEDDILLPAAPNAAEFERLIAQHFLKDARHEQAHSAG